MLSESVLDESCVDDSYVDEKKLQENSIFLCSLEDISVDAGVCALINGMEIAIFRTEDDTVYALGNYDPYSHAYVLSRGLLGETKGRCYVASPMYKHRFDLKTGECLDGKQSVDPFPVFQRQGQVYLSVRTT